MLLFWQMCGLRKATYNLNQVLRVSRQETVPGTSQIAKLLIKTHNYICITWSKTRIMLVISQVITVVLNKSDK